MSDYKTVLDRMVRDAARERQAAEDAAARRHADRVEEIEQIAAPLVAVFNAAKEGYSDRLLCQRFEREDSGTQTPVLWVIQNRAINIWGVRFEGFYVSGRDDHWLEMCQVGAHGLPYGPTYVVEDMSVAVPALLEAITRMINWEGYELPPTIGRRMHR